MTAELMEIRHEFASSSPSLGLDTASRDALADYARLRWPSGTAKAAAAAWGLSMDEARGLVAGRASQTTIDKVMKRGRWAVALPILAAVIGQALDDFLRQEREQYVRNARRTEALERDLGALLGSPAVDPDDMAVGSAPRRIAAPVRGRARSLARSVEG